VWNVEINKWGDIHFKKGMLASLNKFSNLKQGESLKVEFQDGKIVITKDQKK
jgi:antitoxin component of MazEF toxin-antitoxin module